MTERDRRIDLAVAALLFVGAVCLRLGRLDLVVLNADTIGPYFRAWTILDGQGLLPASHAPESGPALYWISTLFLAGADGLREAFERRYVFGALMAPALYLGVVAVGSRAGAVMAGSAAALAPGLLQTLDSGYQGYLAPDVATLVAIGLVVGVSTGRGRPIGWALPAVPVAMMCHPFAVALLPPVVVATAWAWRSDPGSRRALGIGGAAAIGLGGVRLQQLREAPAGLLAEAATGNATGAGPLTVVFDAVVAIPGQDGALAVLLTGLPLAALGLRGAARRMGGLYLLALLGLWAVGGAIGYLQPYHHRILLPFALAIVGALLPATEELLKVRGARYVEAVVVLMVVVAGARALGARDPDGSDLQLHRELAAEIAADAGDEGRWIEFATLGDRAWGSPAALVLEGLLAGGSTAPLQRPGPLYLVVAGPPAALDRIDALDSGRRLRRRRVNGRSGVVTVRLEGPSRSTAWSKGVCAEAGEPLRVERRAADWIAFIRPGYTDAFTTRWFDPCVIGGPEG